ncbi:MAG: hypothetical protein JEZ11_13185 [Desulfobacterales bacterium]|nr:hypothetical protein [Desulfobacterales bacterium]
MPEKTFEALVVRETEDGHFAREIIQREVNDLPPGELLVEVHYSSLNYNGCSLIKNC